MSTEAKNEGQNPQGGRPPGKSKGWYSRRYKSEDESRAAKQRHLEAQRANAKPRRYTKRTPLGQLRHLDRKLGKGVGAARERARLQAQIKAQRAEKTAA